jgi:hypothetical protein
MLSVRVGEIAHTILKEFGVWLRWWRKTDLSVVLQRLGKSVRAAISAAKYPSSVS